MSEQPPTIKGLLSYACTFYSHQFCDGQLETHVRPDSMTQADCSCPCHHYNDKTPTVMK